MVLSFIVPAARSTVKVGIWVFGIGWEVATDVNDMDNFRFVFTSAYVFKMVCTYINPSHMDLHVDFDE